MSYDRHRALEEARRINWRDHEFQYTPELAVHLGLAKAALTPDGPFPPLSETVTCVLGQNRVPLARAEVDELILLSLEASSRSMEVINGVKPERT